jgi:hypothetical protein
MAFQLSPGVRVTEEDLSLVIPSVATTAGAYAGAFQWGPVGEVTTIDSEVDLVKTFGRPTTNTFASFFTAANFLSYGNNLQVVRTIDESSAKNAIANASATPIIVKNDDHYATVSLTGLGEWIAKFPGNVGNSVKVSMADANSFVGWAYSSLFDSAPSTSSYTDVRGGRFDELHIIVLDGNGDITGTRETVLEKFPFVSKARDARNADGSTNYYRDVINSGSDYIRFANHTLVGTTSSGGSAVWGSLGENSTFTNTTSNVTVTLTKGTPSDVASDANLIQAYNILANDELYDISLIPTGNVSATVVNAVIANIATVRKDCVVFASPFPVSAIVSNTNAVTNAIQFANNQLTRTSYAVLDSGWKYQYDRYNDTYRWIPLSGDIAGLCARTDFVADPWFSPAGFNRGAIKNVVKLAYSPTQAERDLLYKAGVNPVVSFPGQGTVLYGDKTLQAKPSAFDRINVRRLFIVLEKAIATAAKYQLFEFNDAFTRAQFRNLVEPFLREVQGRRGVTDFRVVCDETNNTGDVIDRNEFVADIYIKPARAINFIQLNFIATRSGISFEELGA